LQYAHAVCVSKNLLCFLVVDISDVLGGYEKLEGIVGIEIADSSFDVAFDFLFSLLAVTEVIPLAQFFSTLNLNVPREAEELVLVCP